MLYIFYVLYTYYMFNKYIIYLYFVFYKEILFKHMVKSILLSGASDCSVPLVTFPNVYLIIYCLYSQTLFFS